MENNQMTLENNNLDNLSIAFYLIYDMLLKTKNESQYILLFLEFLDNIKLHLFMTILNIRNLIFTLKSENLIDSYKITLLAFAKSEISNQILTHLQLTDHTISFELICFNLSKFKKNKMYIDSHKLIPLTIRSVIDSKNEKKLLPTEITWQFETRIEIINRLICLREYFKLEELQKFNIKNIMYDDVCKMSFKKLAKYYNKTIDKIKNYISKIIELCETFLDIEKTFVSSIMKSNNSNSKNELEDDTNLTNDLLQIDNFVENIEQQNITNNVDDIDNLIDSISDNSESDDNVDLFSEIFSTNDFECDISSLENNNLIQHNIFDKSTDFVILNNSLTNSEFNDDICLDEEL